MKTILKKISNYFTNKAYEPEQSNGSAEETHNKNYSEDERRIKESHDIQGTPFKAVKTDKWWYVVLGSYRLTNQLNTRQEAELHATDTSWEMLMSVMKIMCIEHDKEKEMEWNHKEAEEEATKKEGKRMADMIMKNIPSPEELDKGMEEAREKWENKKTLEEAIDYANELKEQQKKK